MEQGNSHVDCLKLEKEIKKIDKKIDDQVR